MEQGLSIIKVPDTLGRMNPRFPLIEKICDTCGESITLNWGNNSRNKYFCNKTCHQELRKRSKRAELRYNIVRLMRDNPQITEWTPQDLADWLDKSLMRYRVNTNIISQHLRILQNYDGVKQLKKGLWSLNPKMFSEPLGTIIVSKAR